MSARDSRLPGGWSQGRSRNPSIKFVRLSHLRRLRQCEQVAAVCYRIGSAGIEFLLVRTRKGRWTFPKGSTMAGLTHAQAAALEAFEEAGVHGRIEEASFAYYVRHKHTEAEIVVRAHLCEVSRLDAPQEEDRNPTWFSPNQAKQQLRLHRTPDSGDALARVTARAVARIQQAHMFSDASVHTDQKRQFLLPLDKSAVQRRNESASRPRAFIPPV